MEAKTVTAAQATERLRESGMRITPETLRDGILQGAFPFGAAVKTEKSVVCWVFPKDLDKWIHEHL